MFIFVSVYKMQFRFLQDHKKNQTNTSILYDKKNTYFI